MLFPHTESRRVLLQPTRTDDRNSFTGIFLRTGIESVRPTRQAARLSRVLTAGFLLTSRANGKTLGLAAIHQLDPAGHVRCGLYLEPRAGLGLGREAFYLLLNYTFAVYDVSRIIVQTTDASAGVFGAQPRRADDVMETLAEHVYFRGRHWDLYTFDVPRSQWDDNLDEVGTGLLPRGRSWQSVPRNAWEDRWPVTALDR